jgi:hypothetical protein
MANSGEKMYRPGLFGIDQKFNGKKKKFKKVCFP